MIAWGTPEVTRRHGANLAGIPRRPDIVARALGLGLADRAQLELLAAGCEAWGDDPDAFVVLPCCEAVGWAGEAEDPPGHRER